MEWLNIGLACEHCGKDIECKPDNTGTISVIGFEPMFYRHADTKESECVITTTYKVKPYSSCGVWEKYYKEIGMRND